MTLNFSNKQHGFTLVEMIVSVFVFTIIMLIAVSALISVINANRRAQANKAVMNNLHFALESMMREIRTGTGYSSIEGPSFSFTDKDGCGISYDLDVSDDGDGQILRSVVNPGGLSNCPKSSSSYVPLTAPEVDINELEFYPDGTADNDTEQPYVIIIVRGIAGETERTQVEFNLQSVATQRFLDR